MYTEFKSGPSPTDKDRPSLADTLAGAWQELQAGAARGRHAWHTPALATVGADGPEVRTVVLRLASEEQRLLICHTDSRSPKVEQLRSHPRVAWMFYDREAKLQLRATGNVSLHRDDALARERWAGSAARSQRCYFQGAGPGDRLEDDAAGRAAMPSELAQGFEQFLVLRCEVDRLDWLYLRGRGHWRARWRWDGQCWQGAWIAP